MADHHAPVTVSPEELDRARANWHGFTMLMKVGIAATIVVLLLMAAFVV